MKKTTKKIFLMLSAILAISSDSVFAGETNWEEIYIELQSFSLPDTTQHKSLFSGYSKLDPLLASLAIESQKKSLGDVHTKALSLDVPYDEGRVAVALTAANDRAEDDLIDQVKAAGGKVTTSAHGVIYAELPSTSLEKMESITSLSYAAPMGVSYPTALKGANRVVSEGVENTHVAQLHRQGIKGKGIKIGIIDFGYVHYARLQQAGEVPQPIAKKAFNSANDFTRNTEHGTACAEIIHDMAPEAELYLATVSGRDDEIIRAARWLVEQGVNIISFSGGGHFGPINGKAKLDRLIDDVVSNYGVLWVNAAGNEGDNHWAGISTDRNGNNRIDIKNTRNNDVLLLEVNQQRRVSIILTWDDWGDNPQLPAASQDLDLFLFRIQQNGSGQVFQVAESANPQNGRGRPIEVINHVLDPGVYAIALTSTHLTREFNTHLTVQGAAMYPSVARGSIGIPATAKSALAVGAVDVRNEKLEIFSSQGPTDDSRLKPEVSAPDHNLSMAYAGDNKVGRFPGTSAACPHVSGFAALLKQINHNSDVNQLRQLVIKHVRDKGVSGPDNGYGYGYIDASQIEVATNPAPEPDKPEDGDDGKPGQGRNENGDFLSPIEELLK